MNSEIRDQAYRFFIEEAAELLQVIETGLLTLHNERSKAKVHEIMRAAHSIKGGAASVELEEIRTIAHHLEDFFKVLYHDEVNFDAELEGLLLEGFDCLKNPLRQQIEEGGFDGVAALSKAEPIFAELHNRLAPFLNQAEDYLPSSADLGIDIRASIFEVEVEQQLEQLRTAIASAPEHLLLDTLRTTIEVFAGFAELLSLPSFSQVGQATQEALALAPGDLTAIAQSALEHWQRDRAFVLAGAIAQVGEVEEKLQPWGTPSPAPEKDMAYQFFLEEAAELLQVIESGLLTLKEERSKNKVHEIMRAAHSIKGGAASVGLGGIRTLAHHLEDYFKALYQDSVVIDTELEGLLLQGFDCLKTPLLAEIEQGMSNAAECLEAAQEIFRAIEARLGDALHQAEEYIPSSSDLGIDIVTSLFEVDVQQGLEQIETALTSGDNQAMATVLPSVLEMFQGFAELLNLPGFGEICQQVNAALTEKPEEITAITALALENFRGAMQQVQAGDRTRGGEVLPAWAELLSAPNFEDAGLLDLDGFEDAITEVASFHIPLIRENTPTLEELFSDMEEPLLEPTISLEQLEGNSLEEVFGDLPLEEDNQATGLEEVFGDLPLDEVFAGYTAPLSEEEQPSLEEVFGNSEELEAEIKAIEADFDQLPAATPPAPELIPEIPPLPLPAPPPLVTRAQTPAKELTKSAQVPGAGLSVRVDFDRLERMNNLVGELSINHNSLSLQNGQLQFGVKELLNRFTKFAGMSNKLRELSDLMLIAPQNSQQHFLPKTSGEETSLNEFDALEMDRYGRLYSLLQGLLEEMMQLEEAVDDIVLFARGSNQTLDIERQMLTNLRDELMWARMLPLGEVLNRFPRVLRDLSAHYNKPVRLKLTGTGVLVDKAALEKLYDPLLHLLRNAFDHGIESSTVRASQGKSSEGLIEIRAYHQGNQTIVEVRDDGGGLNYEKIRALALKAGLITPEMAAVITKEPLGDLIFEPGFSTAEVVSELSGRGVGLDVVRDQLRSLKGTVSVSSIPGEGKIFTLRLPLTLTIAKLLVCLTQANAGIALPSDSIEEIIIPQPEQIKLSGVERFLLFANQIVPIYRLSELLQYRCPVSNTLPSKALAQVVPSPEDWGLPLLLLRQDQHLYALEVQRLISEQELVIKPFGTAIAAPPYTYGCTILGDGTLIPVINALTLLAQFLNNQGSRPVEVLPALPTPAQLPSYQAPTILVVDDSAALRRTVALTLEKAGYRVLQAKDGRDALEQLQQTTAINMVICDVEMPNMNGFEFLGQRRREPSLMQIPVAMLTSRSSDKHRQLAMQLGAIAYFTKPYIEQQFLTSVENILQQSVSQPLTV